MDERHEIDRLLGEVEALNDGLPLPQPSIQEANGAFTFKVSGQSSFIERDEIGRITRIVGPSSTKTMIRNERQEIVRVDEEFEEFVPEEPETA